MSATELLERLPRVERLREICQAVAMFEAVIMPDWQYRYFSFNCKWAPGQSMASMRNGSGSDHHGVFIKDGAIFKGFDEESPIAQTVEEQGNSPTWIYEGVPPQFQSFLTEPAFSIEHASFCIWRTGTDDRWMMSESTPDGTLTLGYMHLLLDEPLYFHEWATEYYERDVPEASVGRFFSLTPLDSKLVKSVNPEVEFADLKADWEEIGYPVAE